MLLQCPETQTVLQSVVLGGEGGAVNCMSHTSASLCSSAWSLLIGRIFIGVAEDKGLIKEIAVVSWINKYRHYSFLYVLK